MARLLWFLAPVVLLLSIPLYLLVLKRPPPVPKLDLDEWWGPNDLKHKQDTSIRPFKIRFDENMVEDLKDRLKRHCKTLTPPLEGIGFEYGFNTDQIAAWAKYWSEDYKFAEREKFLNKYPHFMTNIQGLNIHFMRIKPEVPPGVETVPLLLLHGWPGSIREFYETIPMLTSVSKDRDFALEIIAPSLPGYGFSDPAVRPGLGAAQAVVVCRNLMRRLGFKQYYLQGGDWGAFMGSIMVTIFPEEVLGHHSNLAMLMSSSATFLQMVGSIYPPLIGVDPKYVDWMYPLSNKYAYILEEMGYLHIHVTKPDTVGVALTDSPIGLLAYVFEKFSTWTNKEFRSAKDGKLEFRWTKDQLLDNLMFYWTTSSITTSIRLYTETFNFKTMDPKMDEIPTSVPTWVLQAKHEIGYQPPSILKLKFRNLINTTVIEDGGHFLAFELPELFAEDVLKAITAFRKLPQNIKTEL